MAMGRKTVNSLGVLVAAVILGGSYFGIVSPIIAGNASAGQELEQAKIIGQSYASKLETFKNGATEETQAATDTMTAFQSLVAQSIDIESASRAIAAALPEGVRLESFNFGATQPAAEIQSVPLNIAGYVAPPEFSETAAPAEGTGEQNQADSVDDAGGTEENLATGPTVVDPSAPISGFNRIPFTIKVTANSYPELAAYLDSLAQQPRLMSVVSIDSSRSEAVSATIYAFAYSGR